MPIRTVLLAAAAGATLVAAAPRAGAPVDVAIRTSMGTIVVRLDTAHAPRTTANFLHYVDTHAYDGGAFYRSVRQRPGGPPPRIAIIQGGLEGKRNVDALAPIPIEPTGKTGLHNTAGTIAMARETDPNSARSEFYINLGDDRKLDSDQFRDRYGYAVFGRVIAGYDVAQKIQNARATDNAMGEALTPPIRIVRVARVK